MKIGQQIIDMVRDKKTQLPTLPLIVEKVLEIARSDDTSASDLAEFIRKDQAISNKILRLSNSAYYGMMKEIDSIPRAVTVIGFNEVISLTIGMSVVSAFKLKHFDHVLNINSLWIHSLCSAFASKNIAKRLGIIDPEQIFINGLLHDMGKVIFVTYFPEEYRSVLLHAYNTKIELYKSENEILGIDHAQLSGMLMERWNFPDNLLLPSKYHHATDKCPPRFQNQSRIVAFSDYLSQGAKIGQSGTQAMPKILSIRDQLGFDKNDSTAMIQELQDKKKEIESFFEIMK